MVRNNKANKFYLIIFTFDVLLVMSNNTDNHLL